MIKLLNATYQHSSNIIHIPNISLNRGDIVGLFGVSGCGKSTAASILAGMRKPSTGIMSLPIKRDNENNPLQWITQQPEFAFNPRWKIKRSLMESGNISLPLLQRYLVEPSWLEKKPHQLSGGELQRVNIVRALTQSTQFLICDEITAQLDPITQQHIWNKLIEDIQERQIGTIIISHNIYLLRQLCSKIIYWSNN
ncbi:ATP-binding cassette domain-containing protein [Vibrio sp. MA40-2]|uniref:ATP-binding cassette domain-containing protein n=1 Tax=Vibrio sp. MA40-2 TaxID=3391828 RepID=UPI0039A4ECAD